jgi:DNA-binding transcriptional ArsR family regulator
MEIEYSHPPPENDARQRMAPEISELTPLDVDDEEPQEPEIEIKYELDKSVDSEIEAEEEEEEEEDWIDDEEEEEEEEEEGEFDWDVPQLDDAGEPSLPSLELDEPAPPDMNAAFGGAAIQIEPGTEPPPVRNAFGGLKNRERSARIEQGLEKSLSRMPMNGEYNAKPDTSINIPMGEPNLESEESAYWVADEIDEPPPETLPSLEQPAMDPISARTFGDTLRAQRTPEPVASTFPLDIGRISNLNDGEIAIVEAATAREISPSDDALQAYLAVGRPRLSQIYNALQKAGILTVRKKGRTRLFRLSDSAKAHLSGGHMEA